MTELEIINSMLASVGEAAVTTVDSSHPSVHQAVNVLNRVNRKIQSRGWYFNTNKKMTLNPDGTGRVLVPEGTLSIRPIDREELVVQRDDVLFDMTDNTDILSRSIAVRRVALIDIEYVPEIVAEYIRTMAVYEFFMEEDGEGNKVKALAFAMTEAYKAANAEHIRWQRSNSLESPRALKVLYPYRRRIWY